MASPYPKPTAQKIAEGNRGKRPLNYQDEPKPDPLIELSPPTWLSPTAKKIWVEDIPAMSKIRLVTKADRNAFAVLCQETGNYIDAQICINALAEKNAEGQSVLLQGGRDGKQPQPNGYLIVQAMVVKKIISLSREFGKTPVGRRQLAIAAQTDIFNDLPGLNGDAKALNDYYN
jgi:P27 family predicted phage terminase small subunit